MAKAEREVRDVGVRYPAERPERDPRPARRWWLLFAALVLATGLMGWWTVARPGGLSAETSLSAQDAAAAASASPSPSIPEIARQQVWTSDTQPTGEFAQNAITLAPALTAGNTVKYVVKVEKGTEVDADEAAREIQRTFDDPRGWAGYGKRNFTLVNVASEADLVINISSPATTAELCKPADVGTKWNCRNGKNVALNSDRWKYMTPTYDDLGTYRSYLVNHEVGHFLGQGHVGCPKAGGPAPVMMQQSLELAGCTPNAWPKLAD